MLLPMNDPWAKSRILLRQELRQVRLNAGLTQAEVAEALGKPQSYVSKLESGDRSLDLIEMREFCMVCGSSLERFVRQFEKMLNKSVG